MNKRVVEEKMANADRVIQNLGERKGDEYRQYRSKLSAFGAAVIMNGLLPAIGYYSKKRPDNQNEYVVVDLIREMFLMDYDKADVSSNKKFFEYMKKDKNVDKFTDQIINYAISLKLVLNMYIPKEGGKESGKE